MIEQSPRHRIRRVDPSEVDRFLAFRARGLVADGDSFRVTRDDDEKLGADHWRERIARDRVVAAVEAGHWTGLGGFTRFDGEKLNHKGLIWGMFVAPEVRGTGVADLIIEDLLAYAQTCVRQVQLTVMADNERAIAFYERHGFERYAIEPAAVAPMWTRC